MIDAGLIFAYILIAACAGAAIILPIIQSLSDPKSLIKAGIGVGVLVVLFVVCFILAGGDTFGADVSSATSKRVGAGLIMFYILALGAIGGIIYTEIVKATK